MLYSNLNSQDICDSLELFKNIDVLLESHELTALTGPNGAGKSTLLGLIKKQALQSGCSVIYGSQSPPDSPLSEGQKQMYRWLEWMDMGLHPESLLLLDEPFRHLDADFRRRALRFLRSAPGYKLVVSHDMDLLQRADRIYHLQNGLLQSYGGNLELYRMERERQAQARRRKSENLRNRLHDNKKKSVEINRRQSHRTKKAVADNETQNIPRSFINKQKNRAEKTAARLDRTINRKSRMLEQEQKDAHAALKTLEEQSGGVVRIPCSPGKKHALVVENLTMDFGDIGSRKDREEPSLIAPMALSDLDLQVGREEVVWLQGKNGTGKSTFLKSILGMRPYQGKVRWGANPFYLSQNLEHFDTERSAEVMFPELWKISCPGTAFPDFGRQKDWRNLLGYSGISGQTLKRSARTLSGGERMKVMLTMAAMAEPGILVLDEPEQNLDLVATEELLQSLRSYQGAILFVSHDCAFAEELDPDRIWQFPS